MTFVLRQVSGTDWPRIANGFADLTFEQSLTYTQASAARIGAYAKYLLLEKDRQPVAAAALRVKTLPGLGRGIVWLPSGPLMQPIDSPPPEADRISAILDRFREELCCRQGHVLRLRPAGISFHDTQLFREAAQASGFTESVQVPPYSSIGIDLAQNHDALVGRLNGKWRTDLRYALKSDLTLEKGDTEEFKQRFLALYKEVQGAKGFRPTITPEFHFDLSGPDFPRQILIAAKDGNDLAGIVVGVCGQTATYLFGATGSKGRRLKAGYFLTWEGVKWAQSCDLRWYDLGGVDPTSNPDVTRFKTRMNGLPILAETFEVRPTGPVSLLISKLEALHARLKRTG